MAVNKSNLKKIGKVYYFRYRINGKEILKSLKTSNLKEAETKRKDIFSSTSDLKTETDVIQKVARAKKLYNPKKFPITTLWDKFEKALQRKGSSEDTINRYRFRIDQFLDWIRLYHSEAVNLSDINNITGQEYSDYLGNTELANKTYNETLNALALVFETFKDDADISRNPFRKENLSRKSKLSVSRKEFSEDQAKDILNSFHNIIIAEKLEVEILFYLGMFAGLRLKDACLLKWESLNLSANRIYVIPAKTRRYGSSVNIPLHPALREKLEPALTWKIDDYVLPKIAERYNRNRDNPRKLVAKVMELNDYVTTLDKENIQESRNKSACQYGFHSLRYTFVSECAKAGIPQSLVQEIVGHKNPAMTRHYTKFDDKFRQKAINSLTFQNAISTQATARESIIKRLETATDATLQEIISLLDKKQVIL